MDPENTPAAGQEPGAGTGLTPTTTQSTLSHDDALAALAKVRREAAEYRTKLATFEAAQQEAERAKLSELDAARKESADLKAENARIAAQAQQSVNQAKAELAASKLGIIDPEVAVKLLDWDSIEYGKDGSPQGLEAAFARLLKAKPYLAGGAGSAPTNPSRGNANSSMSLADVKRLTKDQYARLSDTERAAVLTALASG